MDTKYSAGDSVWIQFANVQNDTKRAWVYPLTVVAVIDDGELVVRDESGRVRTVTENVENVTDSEADGWRACAGTMRWHASECLRIAAECDQKAKGVSHVVA